MIGVIFVIIFDLFDCCFLVFGGFDFNNFGFG